MKKMEQTIHISDLLYKYFHNDLSRKEEEMLEVWLQNPKNMEFFMKINNSNMIYEGMINMQYIDSKYQFQRLKEKIKKKKKKRISIYIYGAIAVLLFGCLITPIVWDVKEPDKRPISLTSPIKQKTVATLIKSSGQVIYLVDSMKSLAIPTVTKHREPLEKSAEAKNEHQQENVYNVLATLEQGNFEIMLSDGTRVWMNEESELRYPDKFQEEQRVVYLKGEAYFEVKKDSLHPFVVKTTSAQINVLGTSFNVNAKEDICITTLVEGCVKMKNFYSDSVIIRPGQQVTMRKGENINVTSVDPLYYIAWKNNQIAFKDTPLKNILEYLEQWYGEKVQIEDLSLADVQYTTIVKRYSNIESVLNILVSIGDFQYTRMDDGIIIIKKK